MDMGGGNRFAGNSWYLYKYIVKNESNVKPICISSSPYVIQKIKSIGGLYCKPNTFKSFLLCSHS